jgi:hypothetical protein
LVNKVEKHMGDSSIISLPSGATKPRLFIGCAKEDLPVAKAIHNHHTGFKKKLERFV